MVCSRLAYGNRTLANLDDPCQDLIDVVNTRFCGQEGSSLAMFARDDENDETGHRSTRLLTPTA